MFYAARDSATCIETNRTIADAAQRKRQKISRRTVMLEQAQKKGMGDAVSVSTILRDRRAKMRSRNGQVKRAGIASPRQPCRGFPFDPALGFMLGDEAWNMVALAIGPSDPNVPSGC